MPFSLGFDELYDLDADHPYTAFEPVASGADFGDLPPSREEQAQDTPSGTSYERAEDPLTGVESADETVETIEIVQELQSASAPEEPSIEAFVEEVEEVEVEAPIVEEEIDVISAAGDDIDLTLSDYVVEEVATEGRLTAVCPYFILSRQATHSRRAGA